MAHSASSVYSSLKTGKSGFQGCVRRGNPASEWSKELVFRTDARLISFQWEPFERSTVICLLHSPFEAGTQETLLVKHAVSLGGEARVFHICSAASNCVSVSGGGASWHKLRR